MHVHVAIIFGCLLVPRIGLADAPPKITRGELALTPEYCPDTQTFETRGFPQNPTVRQARWIAQMGQTFWAMHHYCWAMLGANRAKRAGVAPHERRYLYESAISDCHYVLNNSTPDFVLRPEIYLRMGQFSHALGDLAQALDYLNQSRAQKRDYWPAYLELATVNAAIGRHQAAIDVLNEGLTVLPGQTELTEALNKIAAKPRQ